MLMQATLIRVLILVVLAVSTAGCDLVEGIFKAGVWVGVIAVIAVVLLLVFIVSKLRR